MTLLRSIGVYYLVYDFLFAFLIVTGKFKMEQTISLSSILLGKCALYIGLKLRLFEFNIARYWNLIYQTMGMPKVKKSMVIFYIISMPFRSKLSKFRILPYSEIVAKPCNQVRSLDHFVVQNSGDFLCWAYKEVVCFYVSNLLQYSATEKSTVNQCRADYWSKFET